MAADADLIGPRHTEAVEPAWLPEAILAGRLDAELPEIVTAVNARIAELERVRTERALARLSVGCKVVLTGEVKPKYLRGHTGEVHMIEDGHVVVRLDRPAGRFTEGHISCPPGALLPLGT